MAREYKSDMAREYKSDMAREYKSSLLFDGYGPKRARRKAQLLLCLLVLEIKLLL